MAPQWMLRTVAVAAVGLLSTAPAYADQWNDRTVLTFSDPVIVPGVTLAPGSYVFKLLDSSSARHVVQILRDDERTVVATTQAVPLKRSETTGDVVLKLSPTDRGTPPAIKAWFYPGSRYGHEFVYPENQARLIAQRSKTVVLSTDVPGSNAQRGILRTYDPKGMIGEWRGDASTLGEWYAWRSTRGSTMRGNGSSEDERARQASSAPMVEGDFVATRVALDDLEQNPSKYIGIRLSVDAEVEDVLGPRLFTIDEPNWGDLDGELLVVVPTSLAAIVREDDRVTLTATVKPFVSSDLEREWGWSGLDPSVETDVGMKPILVAERVVGGDSTSVVLIETDPPSASVRGAAGTTTPLTDVAAVAGGDEDLVGRRVTLDDVRVSDAAAQGGFYLESGDQAIFVLPADRNPAHSNGGDMVSVEGVILEAPRGMDAEAELSGEANDDIYLLATRVTRR
jgi:hypothetical protein